MEGQTEAVVIGVDGNLYHAAREPLSDSGWNIYGVGSGFQQIAAVDATTVWGCGNDGVLWQNNHGRWTGTQIMPTGNPAAGVSAGIDRTIWALDTDNVLFVKGAGSRQTLPVPSPSIAPALILDAESRLNFLCIDTGGALWAIRQLAPGGGWAAWRNLGAPAGASVTQFEVAANGSGCLQVFAIGSNSLVWTTGQQNMGGNWSKWSTLGADTPTVSTLAVGQHQDGRLEVFAVIAAGSGITHIWQNVPGGAWTGWALWGTGAATQLAVALDANGCLELVATTASENVPVTLTRQIGPNEGWTSWQSLGAPEYQLQQPVMMRNADGHMEIFGLGDDGTIWHTWDQQGAWTGWVSFGGIAGSPFVIENFIVGQNQDGRLEIFVQAGGALFHIWQTAPSGGWSEWTQLTDRETQCGSMAVVLDQAGALAVVGVTTANALGIVSESAKGGWSGWLTDWQQWFPMVAVPSLAGTPSGAAGNFWAIAMSGELVHWDGATCVARALPSGSTPACVTVGTDGTVWTLATDGTLFCLPPGATQFQPLPGTMTAGSLGVTSTAVLAMSPVADAAAALSRYQNGAWQALDSPLLDNAYWNNAPQVSVGVDGSVWLLDGTGNVWLLTMPGPRLDATAAPLPAGVSLRSLNAALQDAAWGVDTNGGIWRYSAGTWAQFAATLPDATVAQVSTGPSGMPWAIDTEGTAYLYDGNGWQLVGPQLTDKLLQSPTNWALAAQAAYQYQGNDIWSCQDTWWAPRWVAKQLSAAADGTVVMLDAAGELYSMTLASPAFLAGAPGNPAADCAGECRADLGHHTGRHERILRAAAFRRGRLAVDDARSIAVRRRAGCPAALLGHRRHGLATRLSGGASPADLARTGCHVVGQGTIDGVPVDLRHPGHRGEHQYRRTA